MNKLAISLLKFEISELKSRMRNVASTEFKMIYAGQIEEIKQAINSLLHTGNKCEWNDSTIVLKTNCGYITNNFDNDFEFCPYCGKKICIKTIKHKD